MSVDTSTHPFDFSTCWIGKQFKYLELVSSDGCFLRSNVSRIPQRLPFLVRIMLTGSSYPFELKIIAPSRTLTNEVSTHEVN